MLHFRPACLNTLKALIDVKTIEMANQIKVGGLYSSQTSILVQHFSLNCK